MKQNYAEALNRLLKDEGRYTDGVHPYDPGGPTNFGITIFDYRKYINNSGTAASVRDMTVGQAKTIYRGKYWDAQKCDELPSGVDYSIFDYGVNSGIGRSGKVLRRLVGLPADTSAITPEVIVAVKKRDPVQLIHAINDERLHFLQGLKIWPTYGRGWTKRVRGCDAISTRMAGEKVDVPPPPTEKSPKGQDQKPSIPKKTLGAGSSGAAYTFWDVIVAHPYVTAAVVIGAVVGVALIFKYVTNRWQKKHEDVSHITPIPEAINVPSDSIPEGKAPSTEPTPEGV